MRNEKQMKTEKLVRTLTGAAATLLVVGGLSSCAPEPSEGPEAAGSTATSAATSSASTAPTETVKAEELVPLAFEIDPGRAADAPVLGAVTFDISDSTLTFSGADTAPMGAPLRVSAVGRITEPGSGAVGSLSMNGEDEPRGLFGVVNDSTGAPNFVDVRVSDTPAAPVDGFTGITVHVPTETWDAVTVSSWASGAKSRGDLVFVVRD